MSGMELQVIFQLLDDEYQSFLLATTKQHTPCKDYTISTLHYNCPIYQISCNTLSCFNQLFSCTLNLSTFILLLSCPVSEVH